MERVVELSIGLLSRLHPCSPDQRYMASPACTLGTKEVLVGCKRRSLHSLKCSILQAMVEAFAPSKGVSVGRHLGLLLLLREGINALRLSQRAHVTARWHAASDLVASALGLLEVAIGTPVSAPHGLRQAIHLLIVEREDLVGRVAEASHLSFIYW